MLVLCNFLRKFMVSDKTIHYKQKPLEKFLIFTIYQNHDTLALNPLGLLFLKGIVQ